MDLYAKYVSLGYPRGGVEVSDEQLTAGCGRMIYDDKSGLKYYYNDREVDEWFFKHALALENEIENCKLVEAIMRVIPRNAKFVRTWEGIGIEIDNTIVSFSSVADNISSFGKMITNGDEFLIAGEGYSNARPSFEIMKFYGFERKVRVYREIYDGYEYKSFRLGFYKGNSLGFFEIFWYQVTDSANWGDYRDVTKYKRVDRDYILYSNRILAGPGVLLPIREDERPRDVIEQRIPGWVLIDEPSYLVPEYERNYLKKFGNVWIMIDKESKIVKILNAWMNLVEYIKFRNIENLLLLFDRKDFEIIGSTVALVESM